jgi:hypothetical protein
MKPFEQQTYYELLEVAVTASVAEIRDAHSRMLEQYSPDSIAIYALVEPEQLEALRARLTEAMKTLSEPRLRLEYDRTVGVVRPEAVASPPPAPGVKPADEDVPELELSVVQNVVPSVEPVLPVETAPAEEAAPVEPPPTRQEVPEVAPVVAAKEPVREVAGPSMPGVPVAAVSVGAFQGYMFPSAVPQKAMAVPAEAPATAPISAAPAEPAPATPAAVEPVATAPVPVPAAVSPAARAAPVQERPAAASPARPGPATRGVSSAVPPPLPPRSALRTPVQAAAQRAAAAAAAAQAAAAARAGEGVPPAPAAPPAPPEPVSSEQGPVSSAPEVALAVAPRPSPPPPPRESRTKLKSVDLPQDAEFTGEVLRRVREQRGFSLVQLAERTRISTRHLENVEADEYDELPATVYLRGILMNIARELGLDPLKVSRSYLSLAAGAGTNKKR